MGIDDAFGLGLWFGWVVAGLVLLGLEVVLPGVLLMWIGIGALGTGLISAVTAISFPAEVVVFSVLASLSVVLGLRMRRPVGRLNTQTAGLAGRQAVAIVFPTHTGRVRLGDSEWAARVPHDVPPPEPGTRLRVVGVDGTVLIVRPDPS